MDPKENKPLEVNEPQQNQNEQEKPKFRKLKKIIESLDKQIDLLKEKEKKVRKAWTDRFKKNRESAGYLVNVVLGIFGQGEEKKKKKTKLSQDDIKKIETVKNWEETTKELTKERDDLRKQIAEALEERKKMEIELSILVEKDRAEQRMNAEIVEAVVKKATLLREARKDMYEYLMEKVFTMLVDEDGHIRTQVTITHPNQLSKIVALVNKITYLEPGLAKSAEDLIQEFFDRMSKPSISLALALESEKTGVTTTVEQNPSVSTETNNPIQEKLMMMYEITKNILMHTGKIKIGETLYRFLGMDISPEIFPELSKAQKIIAKAFRSEKTDKYIRLYERSNKTENWIQIKLS